MTPLGGSRGSKLVQNDKIVFFQPHFIEVIVGEKDLGFYAFSYTKHKFLVKFHITEKTEKNLQIFILEFFKCDFQIPGKILSGILVQLMFWCLVTYLTSRGHFR